MRCKEKLFKNVNSEGKNKLCGIILINALHLFNKQFKIHRSHNERTKTMEIESLNTKNPSECWNKIKSLGPTHKKSVPSLRRKWCYLFKQ